MLLTYKGSRVRYAYCEPKNFDLVVPGGGLQTLPQIMKNYAPPYEIATNATYIGEGVMVESGHVWADSNVVGRPSLFIKGNKAWFSHDDTEAYSCDMGAGGGPILIIGGTLPDIDLLIPHGQFSGLNERIRRQRLGVGIMPSGLILLAAAEALTLFEWRDWFIGQGVDDACNFDGGYSVSWMEGGSIVFGNDDSNPKQRLRRLSCAFVIRQTKEVAQVATAPLFLQDYIPKGRANRPGRAMKPQYLCLHDTANTNKGADAMAHAKYLKGSAAGLAPVSWHYTVDDKCIVQHLPWNETAYHAGDGGYGKGNSTSVGIEICENPDGDRAKAEDNAIALIIDLLKEVGLTPDKVVPHKFWTNKQCPRVILGRHDGWVDFMAKIRGKLAGGSM